MATVCSVTLIKKFTYRANNSEEWSNRYYLTGAIPASSAAWKTLFDALIAQEKTVFRSTSVVVRAYGYDTDDISPTSVASFDYAAAGATVAGTLAGSGVAFAGDQAQLLEWKTDRLSTKGKPIYLRKYFHDGLVAVGGGDAVLAGYRTTVLALGTKLMDGSFLDARTLRSRTHSDTILATSSPLYVTTRTLKRRGRRP